MKEISKLLMHEKTLIDIELELYAIRVPGNHLIYYFYDDDSGKVTSSQYIIYNDFIIPDYELWKLDSENFRDEVLERIGRA